MPTPSWPSGLQQKINQDNFGLKKGPTTIKSDVDIGPSKVRRRFTKSVDILTASIWINSSEYTTFENFYNIDANGGATPFYFTHPITNLQITVRFMDEPSYRRVGATTFSVSFTLEILG